ncbi:MAG: AAA family ATPase [Acidobacteriota bacterium]|nr:AAA family ATPase [Acidobacteriota bacterium]
MIPAPAGYQILKRIYSSRNSQVFRARRLADSRPVIIKILSDDYPSPAESARYRQEFEITRKLTEPGIIRAYSLENTGRGLMIVLEDFGASSLNILWPEEALPPELFFSPALQAAAALKKIHRAQVIHKDINPSNLVYNPQTDVLKVIDFGIATRLRRVTRYQEHPVNLDGTLPYMSPEQTGRMNRPVDYRTDLYSLGATFYQLLCGRPPFREQDPMALIHCHIARTPDAPHELDPRIPKVLSDIVLRLMEKHAERRYQSARGLEEDLYRCREMLQTRGRIAYFQPGARDFPQRFEPGRKIYGRDSELKVLQQAFLHAGNGPTLVCLRGQSGVGKTALVQELFKPSVRTDCFFITGKFDQFQSGAPCSAVLDALEDLAGQLICLPQAELDTWKTGILNAVKGNGALITEAVPTMEKIIGPQPPPEELDAASTKHRLLHTLTRFIGVFCRPLVMFIDDLQWADTQTLELLEWLVDSNAGFLLIGAYRGKEVTPDHPLSRLQKRIAKESTIYFSIDLEPLQPEDAGLWIADTLRLEPPEVAGLRDLVFDKTGGYPLFMGRFMENLYEQGLLYIEEEENRWGWDETGILAMDFADNRVGMILDRFQNHKRETRDAVSLAACLGNRFDLDELSLVMDCSPLETYHALLPALQDDLVLPLSGLEIHERDNALVIRFFKFSHDRIQQAARQLIPEKELPEVQYRIGSILARHVGEEHKDFFKIVDLLNQGRTLIHEIEERKRLVRLNLSAGQQAMRSAAYERALNYLTIASEGLGPLSWRKDYTLTMEVYQCHVQAAMATGQNEEAEQLLNHALAHARACREKAFLFKDLTLVNLFKNDFPMARKYAESILGCLNIHIPKDLDAHLVHLEKKVIDRLLQTEPESLKPMSDFDEHRLKALDTVSFYPIFFLEDWSFLRFLLLQNIQFALELGHSIGLSECTAVYSGLSKQNGEYERALTIGRWSERLRKHNHYPGVYFNPGFVMGLPVDEMTEFSERCRRACIDTGRFYQAACFMFEYVLLTFILGRKTNDDERLSEYRAFARKHKAGMALDIMTAVQIARNNLEETCGDYVFGSPEEKAFEAGLSNFTGCIYLFAKAEVLLIQGHVEQALKFSNKAQVYAPGIDGTAFLEHHQWTRAVILAANHATMSEEEQTTALTELDRTLEKWRRLVQLNRQFYGYQEAFMRAERMRWKGQFLKALETYKQALEAAHRNGTVRHEALLEERLASLWEDMGHAEYGRRHLILARQCYRMLAVRSKVTELDQRLSDESLDNNVLVSDNTHTSSGRSAEALDLHTLIKVSRAVSSNLDLSELLRKMMAVVIENAGAETGFLLMPAQGCWTVKARGNVQEIKVLPEGIPVDLCDDLCKGAVQRVARSGETLILDDAERAGFKHGHEEHGAIRSLICMPVNTRGRERCILYLENNLNTGAFTRRHLEVLETLTAQMAISLENALLYSNLAATNRTLEQKVIDRTRELKNKNDELARKNREIVQAQEQLVTREKMASLGILTAGVAHEINNPTNFVFGGAQNLDRRLGAFRDYVLLLAEDAPEEVVRDLTEKMEPLFNDCRLILNGSQRISRIVRDLHMFTRKDEAPQKQVSLSEALAATLNLIQANYRNRIDFHAEYRDPLIINCRPAEMNQVFMHLIVNACDAVDERYGKQGGLREGRVSIETSMEDGRAMIRVSDNGCGMPREVREKIFEPFFTTKDVGSGTGLGLSTSYGIVQKHGGSIEVDSHRGKGSTFTITLPVDHAQSY